MRKKTRLVLILAFAAAVSATLLRDLVLLNVSESKLENEKAIHSLHHAEGGWPPKQIRHPPEDQEGGELAKVTVRQ